MTGTISWPRWPGKDLDWLPKRCIALGGPGDCPQARNGADSLGLAPAVTTQSELDHWLALAVYQRLPLPYDAGWLAAQVFVTYRRTRGAKNSALPDFSIGAHAEDEGLMLVTRDATRCRTYFLTVSLIALQATPRYTDFAPKGVEPAAGTYFVDSGRFLGIIRLDEAGIGRLLQRVSDHPFGRGDPPRAAGTRSCRL